MDSDSSENRKEVHRQCITEAQDAALEREFQRDLDGVLNRLALMSNRAKTHGKDSLMYALNRAWRDIDASRRK